MNAKKTIMFRRKREGKTNYKKRLALLKSKKPRLIVRKTNKQVIIQIAEYSHDGDRIVCGLNSKSLNKLGWKYSFNNLPACYLAGLMFGRKALAMKMKEAILDVGLQTPVAGSRVYATLKGVIDAGLNISVSEGIFPTDERLSGKHISSFFSINKNQTQFPAYKKNKIEPSNLQKDIEELKKKILS